MKKIIDLVFSSRSTLILLIIFTIAIGSATFIEEIHDTTTAKLMVYNAKWFEIVLLLLVLNFIGSIKRYHLMRKEKLPGFLFHLAFVIILIGAGITRYIGFEATIQIRQGTSSNFIYSADPYLNIKAQDGSNIYNFNRPVLIGTGAKNSFDTHIVTEDNGPINIKFKDFIPNAITTYEESKESGATIIELTVSDGSHKDLVQIKDGEIKELHGFPISFNNNERPDALKITGQPGELFISFSEAIKASQMPEMTIKLIPKNSLAELKSKHLYELENTGIAVVLSNTFKNAKLKYVPGTTDVEGEEVLLMEVSFKGKEQEVPLIRNLNSAGDFQKVDLDGIELQMAYRLNRMELPFSIRLNKFILERYAGSDSPSSYASEVTLIDERNGTTVDHRIFMNNVLDYDGYRFFQSSYDEDEKGTILTVNHDFYGTWVSYFGYFLLALGFILTLFNYNSRYRDLIRKINKTRIERKTIISVFIIAFISASSLFAQESPNAGSDAQDQNTVSIEHAEKFSHLLVQTYNGRFAPINTLAYDVLHKISRKDVINIKGKGTMKAAQIFIDFPINAAFWKKQKIIYVREKPIMDLLKVSGKYASFNDFFDEGGEYKLGAASEVAFRKKQSDQNPIDKEIIKVNERIEIFISAFQGRLFKIFPTQGASNNKWISLDDPLAQIPLRGRIEKMNNDWQLEELTYSNVMRLYLTEVYNGTNSGDYSKADKVLGDIDRLQRQSSISSSLPSMAKVEKEIHYNNSKIFINLKNIYAILSIVLLVLAFIDNLRVKKSKLLRMVLHAFIVLLGLAFIYHTYGMGLRWYLSGHAPWSNGYEALILVAWGSLLAGFSFARFSKITLAATALLSFFILMTASHSSYDPQLTNLQPVLKSYWLIIHVATMTISYGFLGLAFALGLINMGLFCIKSTSNYRRIDLMIKELTHINEINITIGLLLATLGTFLGGIWANESWGRYWGWDAKETWALVIVLAYTIILHFRLVPKMKSMFVFNVGAVLSFSTVLMTFFGVNYYLSKGLHSYASGEIPIFPQWAWISIFSIIMLMIFAGWRDRFIKKKIRITNA
jgi:cytochrome c-type biogenesis protein CcsB